MCIRDRARQTGASRITLVLAGVAISSILSAAIDAVSILFPEAALGANAFMVDVYKRQYIYIYLIYTSI